MTAGAPRPAQLQLSGEGGRRITLDPRQSLRIGRDPDCGLSLPQVAGLSRRHAELRWSTARGRWELHDLGSANGTFLDGVRLTAPVPLRHGQTIRLGRRGPELLFQQSQPRPVGSGAAAAAGARPDRITVGGESLPLAQIRSVELRSLSRHPQIFSWWVLACLAGLLLLPFPLLFWPLQVGALVGAVLLGSRKDHELVVVLRDGQARRHDFHNRITALSHRNGIRRALGQSPEP